MSGEQAIQGVPNGLARGEGIEVGDIAVTGEDKETRIGIHQETQSTCDSFVTESVTDGRVQPRSGTEYRQLVPQAQ
jgi:hypothetical protein